MSAGDSMRQLLAELAASNEAVLERAIEKAAQGGQHGVLVTHHGDGTLTAEVDPNVPYGYIYERREP